MKKNETKALPSVKIIKNTKKIPDKLPSEMEIRKEQTAAIPLVIKSEKVNIAVKDFFLRKESNMVNMLTNPQAAAKGIEKNNPAMKLKKKPYKPVVLGPMTGSKPTTTDKNSLTSNEIKKLFQK